MTESKIIFAVEESPDGGYEARALGHSIYTQADTLDELKGMVRDALRCHQAEQHSARIGGPIRPQLIAGQERHELFSGDRLDALVLANVEYVPVLTDDMGRASRHGAFKELVVAGVAADGELLIGLHHFGLF